MYKLSNTELINVQHRLDDMGYNSDINLLDAIISEINDEIEKRYHLTFAFEKGNPEVNGWNLKVKDLVDIQSKMIKLGYEADLEVIEDVLICSNEVGNK